MQIPSQVLLVVIDVPVFFVHNFLSSSVLTLLFYSSCYFIPKYDEVPITNFYDGVSCCKGKCKKMRTSH